MVERNTPARPVLHQPCISESRTVFAATGMAMSRQQLQQELIMDKWHEEEERE